MQGGIAGLEGLYVVPYSIYPKKIVPVYFGAYKLE